MLQHSVCLLLRPIVQPPVSCLNSRWVHQMLSKKQNEALRRRELDPMAVCSVRAVSWLSSGGCSQFHVSQSKRGGRVSVPKLCCLFWHQLTASGLQAELREAPILYGCETLAAWAPVWSRAVGRLCLLGCAMQPPFS